MKPSQVTLGSMFNLMPPTASYLGPSCCFPDWEMRSSRLG